MRREGRIGLCMSEVCVNVQASEAGGLWASVGVDELRVRGQVRHGHRRQRNGRARAVPVLNPGVFRLLTERVRAGI